VRHNNQGEIEVAAKADLAVAAQAERPVSLLVDLVGYALRRANNRMMADLSPVLARLALRPVLFAILTVIRANPDIIQMGLGAELGIQRANLVPLINELTGRQLIVRRADPRDRRALTLHLTPAGEALLDEAATLIWAHEERMLATLSAAERIKLLELLEKIAAE
jgi:DNA-binding MarR family transcriptional regulator